MAKLFRKILLFKRQKSVFLSQLFKIPSYFDLTEGTFTQQGTKKASFILPCAHLFVPLHRFCEKTLEHK